MKLILVFIATLLSAFTIYSQTSSEKFKFHSVSASPNLGIVKGSTTLGGEADIVFSKGKHLFKLVAAVGSEAESCFGLCRSVSFTTYDLMYGREFGKLESISFDVFAGVGYFYVRYPDPNNSDYRKENTIGFPVQARLRFMAAKKFNLGIHMGGNINGTSSLIAFGPFFQWTP
jgi:hypothetical protein